MVQQQDYLTGVVIVPDRSEQSDDERRQVMDQFRETIECIGERNRHLDPDFLMTEVTKAVEEMQQERHDRKQVEVRNGR